MKRFFSIFAAALFSVSMFATDYFMKNNWDGGGWTWKQMTAVGDGTYALNKVVFGGTGVNFGTEENDGTATWVAQDAFLGDKATLKALDTVNFVLNPAAGSVTVTIVGAYVAPAGSTYTVAGSSDVLFGASWDAANADNDMTLKSGTLYEIVYTNVTLGAGNVEFKVCVNHDWNPSYPASNYVLTIPEDGIYDVTITFDTSNNSVNATAEKKGSAVVIPSIMMHGNFTGSWENTAEFAIAGNNETATLSLSLAVGDYEFGMRIGGGGNWTSNGSAFTRESASHVIAAGSGNLTLAADVAGSYLFTWTYATNTLAVTYPTATGLDNAAAAENAVKMIENGQLIIIKNGMKYNVVGAVVK